MPQPQQQSHFPPIPSETVQEGARWRHWRPSSDQVAAWFATQPLDEGMSHEQYVGGTVIIPQNEKVKYTRKDGQGTVERFEQVFTPYMQIGTRVAYFRRLAEHRGLIPYSRPAEVPRSTRAESIYFNANMPEGLWWHVVQGDSGPVRYLCSTWRVAFYEPTQYAAKLRGEDPLPVLEGTGTKQVGGYPDINQIAKAQTGSLGRALGVAGMLVVGTGIATAEDMQEFAGTAGTAPELAALPPSEIAPGQQPPPTDPAEEREALKARALALQTQMQEDTPEAWREFVAWYEERKKEEAWQSLDDVPAELMKAVISRMETLYEAGKNRQPETNAGTEVGA